MSKETSTISHERAAALRRTLAAMRRDLSELHGHLDGSQSLVPDAKRQGPALLTVRDLAVMTAFSEHTIRDWVAQGLVPAQKIGNRWRFEAEAAMRAIKNLNRRRRRRRSRG